MRYFILIILLNFSFTAISQVKEPYAELQVQRLSCGGINSISLMIYKEKGVYSADFTSDGSNGMKDLKIAAMSKDQIETCNKFFKNSNVLNNKRAVPHLTFILCFMMAKRLRGSMVVASGMALKN